VLGTLLKPAKPTEAVPPLSQTETQRLLRLAQRQALDTMTEYLSSVAGDLAARVVPIAGGIDSGIAWGQELVVVPARSGPAAETTDITTPSGDRLVATHFVSGPQLPLAVYRAIGLPATSASRPPAAAEPTSGEWVLAVWRQELDHAFAPGHYLETRLMRCGERVVEEVVTSLALAADMAGGGLFDLDGSLLGIVLPCGGRETAISSRSVTRLLAEGRTLEGQLLARFGMRVVSLDEDLKKHLGVSEGVMIREVWTGYPSDRAGLRPGDVLQSVNDQAITAPPDLQPLPFGAAEEGWLLGVRRGRRRLDLTLVSAASSGGGLDAEPGGVVFDSPSAGHRIADVVPGSRGDEAGLQPGDRILRVDDAAPRGPADVRRVLEGKKAAFLVLERDGRRIGLLLPR